MHVLASRCLGNIIETLRARIGVHSTMRIALSKDVGCAEIRCMFIKVEGLGARTSKTISNQITKISFSY